jgi:hypothetical protein
VLSEGLGLFGIHAVLRKDGTTGLEGEADKRHLPQIACERQRRESCDLGATCVRQKTQVRGPPRARRHERRGRDIGVANRARGTVGRPTWRRRGATLPCVSQGPALAIVVSCMDSPSYRSCSWVASVKGLQRGAVALAALALGACSNDGLCNTPGGPAPCSQIHQASGSATTSGSGGGGGASGAGAGAGTNGAGGGTGIAGMSGSAGMDGLSPDAGEDSASVGGGRTLTLEAYGGPSGHVAADVPLDEPGVGPQETCTGPINAGACHLTSCTGSGGFGNSVTGYGNFGPISVSVGTTTVPLTYGGFGYGTIYFPPSITLGTGGQMRFQGGDGVGVPRFDVSATIPGPAVLTSPVSTTDGGTANIDTSRDLTVTWVPISLGQIGFQFSAGSNLVDDRVAISVSCSFEGASGSGVVPQTILSSLKEMVGTKATYAYVSSGLEAKTVVDGLTIVLQSYQSSPATDHALSVTLE